MPKDRDASTEVAEQGGKQEAHRTEAGVLDSHRLNGCGSHAPVLLCLPLSPKGL